MIDVTVKKNLITELFQEPQKFFAETRPTIPLQSLKNSYVGALLLSGVIGGLLSSSIEGGIYRTFMNAIIHAIIAGHVLIATRVSKCDFSNRSYLDIYNTLVLNFLAMSLSSVATQILSLSYVGIVISIPIYVLNVFWLYRNVQFGMNMSESQAKSTILSPILTFMCIAFFMMLVFRGF
jgi:hypothetical protein